MPLSNGYTKINIMDSSIKNIQKLLQITYGAVPIVAGADKFTNLLTDWEKYLNPVVAQNLPVSAHAFMLIVGVIEIVAGILVFINAEKGSYLVCIWLVSIALSLLAGGNYLDVAVRDLVMAIGAFSLAKISSALKVSSAS
ncbi:MAG: hypothetical protein JWQ25_682 [Daejeonella sp.]|nr:hypothetical protein [Daejeonella sp.]